MAPDFNIDLTDAERFHLSDHLGKDVIVIDFWSTYCTPCVAVMHHLEAMHKRLKNKGLVILAVAMDPPESAGQIVPFIRSHDFTFRVAHDINSEITQLYNKKSSAPYQVLIGRDGKIRKVRDAYHPGDEVGMQADILAAVAEK
jgi:peroxiredoxin